MKHERSPNAFLFSEREDSENGVEYLAEEDRVSAWKLHKEIYTTSGKYKDSQLKFFRLRRHGKQEYISRCHFSCGVRIHH